MIGGGLVGSMVSCFLAKHGLSVDLYEMREDPRILRDSYTGKSINLAISERGRSALRALGIEDEVIKQHAIPMKARLIHDKNGSKRSIPYGQEGQSIYSVSRRFLNQRLLDLASSHENVNISFHHKSLFVDFESMKVDFVVRQPTNGVIPGTPLHHYNSERKTISADVIVGCDGAYSSVRKSLMKVLRMNYSQEYIDHGYLELTIPATNDDNFAMEVNFLHIWPRDEFMMIALPNQDKSFTVTLFMPFEKFESIKSRTQLLDFFSEYFPDSLDLIGRDNLVKDFFGNKASSLVSIKCSPIHFEGKGIIIGDAAHAMVPFFGQGMNCGFEDCLILSDIMSKYLKDVSQSNNKNIMERVFADFEITRNRDHHVICDLAMYNYIEMRHLVNSISFLIRKKTDLCLNRWFPSSWLSLYQMVTFSRIPYSECLLRRKRQDYLLYLTTMIGSSSALAVSVAYLLFKRRPTSFTASVLIGKVLRSFMP